MSTYNWPLSMPYDEINVYDQTNYEDQSTDIDVVTIPDGPLAFIPFVSPKGYGDDNKLVYLTSSSIGRYGNPNFDKYGLSLYLANQFIAGGGNIVGMRLKADNATHANVGIVANVKIVTEPIVEEGVSTKDGKTTVVYYPYFQKAGNTSEIPRYFEGITYTYASTDEAGVEQPESIVIDETAGYTESGTKVLYKDIYKVDGTTLTDATTNEVLYTMVKEKVVRCNLEMKSFSDVKDAGSKEALEAAFANYVNENSENQLPENPSDMNEGVQYSIPIAMWYLRPTGNNTYSITIGYDTSMEAYGKNIGASNRFYNARVYEGNTEIEKKVSFTFGDYIYNLQSMNILDVTEDYYANVGYIAGKIDAFYAILDEYVTGDTSLDGTDSSVIDILFARDRDGNEYYKYKVDNVDPDTDTFGYVLKTMGGSAGDFESTDVDVRNNSFAHAFEAAYTGEITDLIFDEVRYPYQFLFQPCDNTTVCDSIKTLTDNRHSTTAAMYIPFTKSYPEARAAMGGTYSSYSSAKLYYYAESAIIRDPYTHKRVRMPSTYFNAKAIPRLLKTEGYGAPLAGSKFYWDGFIVNTMLPQSTNNNQYIENHNVRLNTMVEDGAGRAQAVEQITSQSSTSQLSEINNSITLSKICAIALSTAKNHRWSDITNETDIAEYQNRVLTAIQGTLPSKAYNTLTITASRESVNGAGKNRIHCVIHVSFRSLLKGVTYDIYII